jgi:hypothetical protein
VTKLVQGQRAGYWHGRGRQRSKRWLVLYKGTAGKRQSKRGSGAHFTTQRFPQIFVVCTLEHHAPFNTGLEHSFYETLSIAPPLGCETNGVRHIAVSKAQS